MTILEILTKKIAELKENSQDELDRIKGILQTIDDAIDALNNEKKLKDYNFDTATNLVNSHSFGIIDLNKCLDEVKNTLIAKYDYKQDYLTLSSNQLQALKSFKERLGFLRDEFESRLKNHNENKVNPLVLENLIDFKNLLEGKGRRKYYTYEMLEAFCEVIDYDSFTFDDMRDLIKSLSVSKNLKSKLNEEQNDY